MTVSLADRYSPIHMENVAHCRPGSPFPFLENSKSSMKDIVIVETSDFYVSALFKDKRVTSDGKICALPDMKRKHKPVQNVLAHEKKRRVINSKLNKMMAAL